MAKMWAGVTDGITSKIADDFNSSISFDSRMYREDITGSQAHAKMLAKQGIITDSERDEIVSGLEGILRDIDSGALRFDPDCEDIHMFVEQVLTERIGESGKKLHTARSRNDQVALDLRLYLRGQTDSLTLLLKDAAEALLQKAEEYKDAVMPGYTHLQRAQPVLFGHWLLAYCMMLLRDLDRLKDCRKRMNISPIGACALAGTTYSTDRRYEAGLLGFSDICRNSVDAVSDRDFALELMSCLSILQTHLSRLCEELILWSSWEFRFISLSDSFTTGSSIMPQKKNPDMAELIRGKTGRVYGDLMTLLTALKGTPLAYNKDMQEDKEAVFDCVDAVAACLTVLAPMIREMKANRENMLSAAKKGFINATDLADYLVRKGLPFRSAYKAAGQAVKRCTDLGLDLESLPIEEYRSISDLISEDVYTDISLSECVKRRISEGGTGYASVDGQIEYVKQELSKY